MTPLGVHLDLVWLTLMYPTLKMLKRVDVNVPLAPLNSLQSLATCPRNSLAFPSATAFRHWGQYKRDQSATPNLQIQKNTASARVFSKKLAGTFAFLVEDKRATTNVQHRFVLFFLLSCLLFCSHWAKILCFEGESPGGKILKKCEKKVRKAWKFWNDFAL